MVAHGPRRRMGRFVHFSVLVPVWRGPMRVSARFSEVPQDGGP